jgi:hypothetical protein
LLLLADGLAGPTQPFNPRCELFPTPQWDFLMPGMGGYSGGRFLKKIVTNVQAQRSRK